MPRKLPEKVRKGSRKLRKRGSKKRYRSSQPFLQRAPVRRTQELEVIIDDIGSEGDGIAIMHGYRIFVRGGKVGERVKVRIVSVGSKFAVAEKIA